MFEGVGAGLALCPDGLASDPTVHAARRRKRPINATSLGAESRA
jgi:hypothetical protein